MWIWFESKFLIYENQFFISLPYNTVVQKEAYKIRGE